MPAVMSDEAAAAWASDQPRPGDLVPVFLVNWHYPGGPGVRQVPRAEAEALVASGYAVRGDQGPRG